MAQGKKTVSVGIYGEELWWQRDGWERCLWSWGFRATTVKRIEVCACLAKQGQWIRKRRVKWTQIWLNAYTMLQLSTWVIPLLQTKYVIICSSWDCRKVGELKNLVISWKKQVNNFEVAWLWLNSKYVKVQETFRIVQWWGNKNKILR